MEMIEEISFDLLTRFVAWKKKVQRTYEATEKDKENCLIAAKYCLDNTIEPHRYFLAQIDGLEEPTKIEKYTSNRFAGKRAMARVERYADKNFTKQPEPREIFEQCAFNVTQIMQMHEDPELMLLSRKYDFPAWFRIVITREPMQAVIDKYQKEALMELRADARIEPFIKTIPMISTHLQRITDGR